MAVATQFAYLATNIPQTAHLAPGGGAGTVFGPTAIAGAPTASTTRRTNPVIPFIPSPPFTSGLPAAPYQLHRPVSRTPAARLHSIQFSNQLLGHLGPSPRV